jgi:tetratricopeptide (TPR) repeat protein
MVQLSDLLDEQGRSQAAVDRLRRALQAAPDYADAMFNLALLLQRRSRHEEAAEYWRQYLANDALSEWATRGTSIPKILRTANSSVSVLRSFGSAHVTVGSRAAHRRKIFADRAALLTSRFARASQALKR